METVNAVLAADLPDDPPWQDVQVREYLAETVPGERRICWVAEDDRLPEGESEIFAHVSILLLGDIGVLEVMVKPSLRRRGLGRQLVAVAARRAYLEGFSSIGVEAIGGTPAIAFYEALGFEREYVETRSVLNLAAVDWPTLREMAGGIAPGYRVEYHPGGPPEELLEAYAQAKLEAQDDDDDLDLAPRSSDPQRLRDSLDTLHKRGLKPYIVLAIHEATGDGGRADRGGRAGAAPGARRPVRHDRRARAPRLRHRPRDQGPDAVRAARRRAGPARGADLERAATTSRCSRSTPSSATSPTGTGSSTAPTSAQLVPAAMEPDDEAQSQAAQ